MSKIIAAETYYKYLSQIFWLLFKQVLFLLQFVSSLSQLLQSCLLVDTRLVMQDALLTPLLAHTFVVLSIGCKDGLGNCVIRSMLLKCFERETCHLVDLKVELGGRGWRCG